MCGLVMGMFTRLSNCANRTILYDMYSYVWDIKSIMSMVKSFVQWLGRCTRNNLFSDILSLKRKKKLSHREKNIYGISEFPTVFKFLA